MKLFKFDWLSGYGNLRCYVKAENEKSAIEIYNTKSNWTWSGTSKYDTITEVNQRDNDGVPLFE